jgi:hypothetical protein
MEAVEPTSEDEPEPVVEPERILSEPIAEEEVIV